MNNPKKFTAALCVACCGAAVFGQPIPPPAGAINHTYKTLTEVEPRTVINLANTPGDADSVFRITASGSYYLDRSYAFTAAQIAGKAGIEIASDDVTIDFMGFNMRGDTLPNAGRQCIVLGAGIENITIRNGSMVAWGLGGIVGSTSDQVSIEGMTIDTVSNLAPGGPGIHLRTNAIIRNCRVENIGNSQRGIIVGASSTIADVTVLQDATTGGGITVNGEGSTIRNALVAGATGAGITAGTNSISIQDSTVRRSTLQGVVCGNDSTLTRVQSFNNTGIGMSVGACSTVSECTANNNAATGITIGANSKVLNSSSCVNTGAGISAGARSVVSTCTANLNTTNGFSTGSGCVVSNSTAADNTLDGFNCGDENTVNTCTAAGNDNDGFQMGDSGRIYGCTASGNNVHGIRLANDTLCRDNTCEVNGVGAGVVDGSGIFVLAATGNDNRIDSNSVIENDFGITALGTFENNLVIRNSATGNSAGNYNLSANNATGTIVSIVPGTGGTIITSNSFANFEY